ncbi:MAG TPA: NUDIX domain-containing protein [Bacteroidales bacterium]|nr:NUDIX domain-containing protein [Bacteroidales bacterium]
METGKFVVRVYGIGVHENKILVIDEFWYGTQMTKFPGGGLEFGEGAIDCLKRECREELGQEVEITGHFYTTDFFQETRFHPGNQLISIYYMMNFTDPQAIKTATKPFDFEFKEGNISPRWIELDTLNIDDLTLPVDRFVATKILAWWKKSVASKVGKRTIKTD